MRRAVLGGLLLTACVQGAATPARSGYVLVEGRRIYCEQRGEGRPLVLLHGGLSSIQASFGGQLAKFAEGHRVIALEQVGHGHTPDADLPYTYARMADDTAAVLRGLGIRNADVVGWSDGATVGLLLARRHPELVRRLVAAGGHARQVFWSPEEAKRCRALSGEDLARRMPAAAREAYGKVSPDGEARLPQVLRKVYDLWLTPVVLEDADLAAVQAPTLVVCGDRDAVPLEHEIALYRALPKGQLLVLPGTGHEVFQQAAERLDPAVLAFLDAP